MISIEEIDSSGVLAFDQPNFQLPQETGDRQPEIVPHHDKTLNASTITLAQGLDQVRVLFFPLGVQPLLELVKNHQHFLANRNALSPAEGSQRLFQTQVER